VALDIYVGSLSRYHAGNWKNIVQQAAEAQGIPYQIIRSDDAKCVPEDEVESAVRNWQAHLLSGLADQGIHIGHWNEGQGVPYETDRPGWEGYYGLILKGQSFLDPSASSPTLLPDLETIHEHPVVVASQSPDSLMCLLSVAEWWLPGNHRHFVEFQSITGAEVAAAPTADLFRLLNDIAEAWGKEPSEIIAFRPDQPDSNCTVDEAALYGLSVLLRMASKSLEMGLPMVLDY
jgi:hypothetical protein